MSYDVGEVMESLEKEQSSFLVPLYIVFSHIFGVQNIWSTVYLLRLNLIDGPQ